MRAKQPVSGASPTLRNAIKIIPLVRPSIPVSVYLYQSSTSSTDNRIFVKFDIGLVFKIFQEFKIQLKQDRNNGQITQRPNAILRASDCIGIQQFAVFISLSLKICCDASEKHLF
jgi:hypothetical protein